MGVPGSGDLVPRGTDSRRASDADRDAVAKVLGDHLAAGRLTVDEHSERLQLVYSSRTLGELEVVTHDLPVPVEGSRRRPKASAKRSEARTSFLVHFGVYAIVMAFLFLIWLFTSPGGYFWPIWPILGWGVGVGIHGVVAAVNPEELEKTKHEAAREDAGRPAPRRVPARHWVAVMFTDIANSTSLTQALGDEEWSRLRARHREMLRQLFAAHDGTEVSAQGDGFLARFAAPAGAVACAIAIQRSLEHMREQGAVVPKVRIGIHAGEAITEDDGDVVGTVVNLASRVTAEAEPGEILVTEPVADHAGSARLEDRGLRPLRGIATPRHLLAIDWS